ncbi:MAG: alanine dehydrogenase [Alphaproteobacteria bacterium]|mgnify:CR=1 FL=1|jgi:alanine dehydrogenase|nr:alanine dehydrogenase [Alphaproteobacteria bacterium]
MKNMKIGVPKEVKPGEGRVAMLPVQAADLVEAGHEVLVQSTAGSASSVSDQDYANAGAQMMASGQEIYAAADLIIKVKEIMPTEYDFLRPEHVIFTNVHGAANREQIDKMLEVGLTAIAAEETHQYGSPNSALAGEVGAFEGLRLVFAPHGGSGRHFLNHYGAPAAEALVIGLGGVGQGALRTLLKLGVSVKAFDIDVGARRRTLMQWEDSPLQVFDISELGDHLASADVIYNCVLWPKDRDDHLIFRKDLAKLSRTSVLVDISCDPAGAIETSRATTWDEPVYVEEGIRHFCVDNIPGAVPVTASAGYARDLFDNIKLIAELGALDACRQNDYLAKGLTCCAGELILAEAGRFQNRPYTPVEEFLKRASA